MNTQRVKNQVMPLVESLDDRVMLSAALTIGTPGAAAVEITRSTISNARLIHRFNANVHHRQGRFHAPKAGHTNLHNSIPIHLQRRSLPVQSTAAGSGIGTRGTGAGTSPLAFGTTTFTQLPTGLVGTVFSPDTSVVTGTNGAGVYSGLDLFGIGSGYETGIALSDDGAIACC